MARGSDLVMTAASKRGAPYSAGSDRFGPVHYDCSGLIHASLRVLGVNDDGARGWTSLTFEDWCRAAKRTISVAEAKTTTGALVFLGHQGGPGGHIGISTGDGRVVETPSAEGHQVGYSPFGRNHWDAGGLVPGLTYQGDLGAAGPGPGGSSTSSDGGDGGGGLSAVGDFLDTLTDPHTWERAGLILGGSALVILAARILKVDLGLPSLPKS